MLNFAKAIGANTDLLTAQAFIFPEENENKLLVVVLSGSAEEGFVKIRKVGLDCREVFFDSEQAISERFSSVSQFTKDSLSDIEKLQGLVSFFDGDTLYLQTINTFDTFLLRKGSLTNLSAGLESDKLISGLLETGDKILFLSPPLVDLSEDWRQNLVESLLKTNPDNLEYELEVFLQQQSHPDPVATVLVENISSQEDQQQTEQPSNLPSSDQLTLTNPNLSLLPKLRSANPQALIGKLGLRRVAILLLVVVIGIFVMSSYLRQRFQQDRLFSTYLQQAQHSLDQALNLKDSDPDQAKQALSQAKNSLKQALSLKPKDSQALSFQARLQDQSYQILKEYEVNNWPVFLDLNLIKQGFTTSSMSYSLGQVALLDKNTKTLVLLKLDQKLPQILAGSLQLGDAQFASLNGDNLFVFSKDKGVLKIDVGNGKITPAIKADPDWQRIVDLVGFASNVYLLDEFKNQVLKYIVTTNGFSEKNNYLKVGVNADFAGARRLQIDGAVWVLKSNNKVLKYIQGGEDWFAFQNFDQELLNIKSFYTSDETDNIYFLDNDNARVVLTKKNGQYVAQYKGDKFKTADDLIVNEKSKKIYLLEANKIYQLDLK